MTTITTAAPTGRLSEAWRWRLLLAATVAALIIIWQLLVTFGVVERVFLPPPGEVAGEFFGLVRTGEFWSAFLRSFRNLVVGVVIAVVFGVSIGLFVGWLPVLRITAAPFLWILYATPKVALAPVIILAFGLGDTSKVALVVLLAIFPILLNTMEGAAAVSGSLVDAGRVFGLKGIPFGVKIVLPATLPYSLAGVQRGAVLGFTGVVLGEFLGGAGGLGHMLEYAAFQFDMARAIALVIVMVVIANLTLRLINFLRRRLAPWYDDEVIGR